MEKKPYITEAIIGNSSMLVSLTKDGQAQRITWPNIDFPQHLNLFYTGIRGIEGSIKTFFLHDNVWKHQQAYISGTNILETVSTLGEVGLSIRQLDFVVPEQDVYIRHFTFRNISDYPQNLDFVVYSDFMIDEKRRYQTVMFDEATDSFVHYHREYGFAIGSDTPVKKYQCGATFKETNDGYLPGKRIANRSSAGIEYGPIHIPANGEHSITLYIAAGMGGKEALKNLRQAKHSTFDELYNQTVEYWHQYLKEANLVEFKDERGKHLYERSLLMFHLMNNRNGGFIAAPEVDEEYAYSGGYAYCWGRDAAYTATAYARAGYHERVRHFFRFACSLQEDNGSWEHRHYLDGYLAPSWGLQIDETGSILWGMHQFYSLTKDDSFIEEMWPTVEKGADFLTRFIDPVTHLPLPSMDIWEKREAEHFYSAAAVYGGLMGAAEFAAKQGFADKAQLYVKTAEAMKKTILQIGYNATSGSFFRAFHLRLDEPAYQNKKAQGKDVAMEYDRKGYPVYRQIRDDVIDICLLGLQVPFNMIEADDPKMKQTAATIDRLCRSKIIGGIERFPGDIYISGDPWIIATLWLAIYYARINQQLEAKKLYNWVVDHATELGLLAEQIDKVTGRPAWVLPLTWSHAMFILTVLEFKERGIEV